LSGDGRNLVVFACGRKRSGKSHQLAKIAGAFPRRIIFDFVGEFYRKIDGAIEARNLVQAADALRQARKRGNRWTVLCMMDPADVPALVGAIAPIGSIPEQSFSYAVGGVALECGECDRILPNNAGISPELLDAIQRGRHFRLSSLFGTQRPRQTHRVLTSQADVILAFRQREPRDVDFLGELMRHDVPEYVRRLQGHEFVRYFDATGRLERVAENGKAIVIAEPLP
jgi:hypothetical protein